MSKEAFQIAEKRSARQRRKSKIHSLNAGFQRIARKDKKAFLSEQCNKTEENNRIGKTRDIFEKIVDIKGTFHAKMGIIKDRNGKDLIEAEEIKKRQHRKNTQNCTKKAFMTQITKMV